MSFLMTVPDEVGSAATGLTDIGSSLNAARTAAALPTVGIVAAAGDQVSAAVAVPAMMARFRKSSRNASLVSAIR